MRLLNTIYVTDHRARVTVRKEAVEVRTGRELTARYPMAGTDSIILASAANITTQALGRCVDHGIRVASLHRSGRVRFIVTGATSGNVQLRTLQHQAAVDPELSLHLARRFVAGKIQNQRRLTARWSADNTGPTRSLIDQQRETLHERLRAIDHTTDPDTLRGLEGDAARRYFKALGAHLEAHAPPFVMLSRTRRPPTDPTNTLLSFLYGLLTTASAGALEAVGLDPQIGFLHRARPGRPSLALDLLEEFRPAIADRLAVSLLCTRRIGPEDFTTAGDAYYLSHEGRRKLLAAYDERLAQPTHHKLLAEDVPIALLPTIQATLLARHLRGDLPDYPPYISEARWRSSSPTTSPPTPRRGNGDSPEPLGSARATGSGYRTPSSNAG